jgi:hypothetical protein
MRGRRCLGCGNRYDGVWLKSVKRNWSGVQLVSSDAPERQFVDCCALRALFDLGGDCALWVALTADRERRASLKVKDGDHLPGKTPKKLLIGLIPVGRQLT